jgi:hypothetical protein
MMVHAAVQQLCIAGWQRSSRFTLLSSGVVKRRPCLLLYMRLPGTVWQPDTAVQHSPFSA